MKVYEFFQQDNGGNEEKEAGEVDNENQECNESK